MQTQPRPAQRERVLYYWSRLYAGQLARGDGYGDLRPCAVVLILGFEALDSARFHSIFEVRERHDHALFSDQLALHVVELPKIGLAENDEPALARWGKFLGATSDEQLEELAMKDPVLQQAKTALERLSADPDARLRAEQREMALKSYQLDLGKAHRDGKAEGRAEGKAEGKAEAFTELLLLQLETKFGVLPDTVTTRVRRASSDEVKRWAGCFVTAESLDAVFDG